MLGKGETVISKAVTTTFKFLDRCHTMTIDDEMIGKAVVANTFVSGGKALEILEHHDIVKMEKNFLKV